VKKRKETMTSGSSRTLMDFFEPAASAKRIKLSSSSPDSALCKSIKPHCQSESQSHTHLSSEDDTSPNNAQQKARMEFNRSLAKAKLNLKICSKNVSKAKGKLCFFLFFFWLLLAF
jgi:uracil-DNA glycosylase